MIIASVEPAEGKVGDEIVISGSALRTGPAESAGPGSVTFNGVRSKPSEWSDEKICVVVPEGASTGPLCVAYSGDAVEVPFEVYSESGEEREERLSKKYKEEEDKKVADEKKAAADEKKAVADAKKEDKK